MALGHLSIAVVRTVSSAPVISARDRLLVHLCVTRIPLDVSLAACPVTKIVMSEIPY
jgi:hypothetical protein